MIVGPVVVAVMVVPVVIIGPVAVVAVMIVPVVIVGPIAIVAVMVVTMMIVIGRSGCWHECWG